MSGNFVCPKCGSENIQKCSVIYRNGTVGHSFTTRSGDYSAETSGVESTELAQSVAPPQKKDTSWGLMIGLGLFSFFSFLDDIYILALILGVMAIGAYSSSQEASDYNNKQWPKEYRAWENSYLCHRCGHYFQLKD